MDVLVVDFLWKESNVICSKRFQSLPPRMREAAGAYTLY